MGSKIFAGDDKIAAINFGIDKIIYPCFLLLSIISNLLKIYHGIPASWVLPWALNQACILVFMLCSPQPSIIRLNLKSLLGFLFFHAFLFYQTDLKDAQLTSLGWKILPFINYTYSAALFVCYLNLGKNIGMLPSLKKISTGGAYHFVRHPIYLVWICINLTNLCVYLSPINIALFFIFCCGVYLRINQEEIVLMNDDSYIKYTKLIRKRLIHPSVLLPAVFLFGFNTNVILFTKKLIQFF